MARTSIFKSCIVSLTHFTKFNLVYYFISIYARTCITTPYYYEMMTRFTQCHIIIKVMQCSNNCWLSKQAYSLFVSIRYEIKRLACWAMSVNRTSQHAGLIVINCTKNPAQPGKQHQNRNHHKYMNFTRVLFDCRNYSWVVGRLFGSRILWQ